MTLERVIQGMSDEELATQINQISSALDRGEYSQAMRRTMIRIRDTYLEVEKRRKEAA